MIGQGSLIIGKAVRRSPQISREQTTNEERGKITSPEHLVEAKQQKSVPKASGNAAIEHPKKYVSTNCIKSQVKQKKKKKRIGGCIPEKTKKKKYQAS